MKRAQRPQNMFLFDPDFRYRLDEDNQDLEQTNNAQNIGNKAQIRRRYPYSNEFFLFFENIVEVNIFTCYPL